MCLYSLDTNNWNTKPNGRRIDNPHRYKMLLASYYQLIKKRKLNWERMHSVQWSKSPEDSYRDNRNCYFPLGAKNLFNLIIIGEVLLKPAIRDKFKDRQNDDLLFESGPSGGRALAIIEIKVVFIIMVHTDSRESRPYKNHDLEQASGSQ